MNRMSVMLMRVVVLVMILMFVVLSLVSEGIVVGLYVIVVIGRYRRMVKVLMMIVRIVLE